MKNQHQKIADNKEAKVKSTKTAKKRWHFSLLTLLLVVFLAQLFWGILVNSAKIYSLNTKIAKLEKIRSVAEKKNQFLREELDKYTSNSGVEALARDRLQFSREDETLIIIKNPQEDDDNIN